MNYLRMYNLFLDDERNPGDVTWIRLPSVEWVIVRSYEEAVNYVKKHGFMKIASFDHDLGMDHYAGNYDDGQTGYDFAKWLIEYDMDTNSMPENFKFIVHSMNPIGGENIRNLLGGYLRYRNSSH
jgi:hypothetical protein